MSDASPRSLRIRAEEVLARLRRGEAVRFLDARSEKAWHGSEEKIVGAVRIRPLLLTVDPAWERTQLTVIY
jgi:hypothetical protein